MGRAAVGTGIASVPRERRSQAAAPVLITAIARTEPREKQKTIAVLLAASLPPVAVLVAFECNITVQSVLVYSNGLVGVRHSRRGVYTVIAT